MKKRHIGRRSSTFVSIFSGIFAFSVTFLFISLYRVTELSQTNQMHAKNIATCLFPTFFSDIFAGQFSAETFTTDSGIYIDILVILIGKSVLFESLLTANFRKARQNFHQRCRPGQECETAKRPRSRGLSYQ